ncbi:MAG: hypothetical protein KF752_12910 [Pirellulaceae bacterium]|nr:hypothetical protein [Pirellulaceae bacterium]
MNPLLSLKRACRLPRDQRWTVAIVLFFAGLTSGQIHADSHRQAAKAVFQCNFQSGYDANSDRQPDGWRRRRDRHHPAYLTAEIVPRNPQQFREAQSTQILLARLWQAWKTKSWDPNYVPETIPPLITQLMDGVALTNCYQVQIDGGAFELVSPRFDLNSQYCYCMEADIACQKLAGHEAVIELHIYRASAEAVEVLCTPGQTGDFDWRTVRSKLIELPVDELIQGEVHIRVRPTIDAFSRGVVRFDNIKVLQFPRLTLTTDAAHHITQTGRSVQLNFIAKGLPRPYQTLRCELLDVERQIVEATNVPLESIDTKSQGNQRMGSESTEGTRLISKPSAPSTSSPPTNRLVAKRDLASGPSTSPAENAFALAAKWQFVPERQGFYFVRASVDGDFTTEIPLAVMDLRPQSGGPFGWSIPSESSGTQLGPLVTMAERAAVGWVKLPIWYDAHSPPDVDTLRKQLSQLSRRGVRCVGRFDHARDGQFLGRSRDNQLPSAAMAFSDPAIWEQSIEPALAAWGAQLSGIQLGDEQDFSFVQNPEALQHISQMLTRLRSIGHDAPWTVVWDWLHPIDILPHAARPEPSNSAGNMPWANSASPGAALAGRPLSNAVHYSTNPHLTAQELAAYIQQTPASNQTWVSINPVSAEKYSLRDRVLDLLQKMIVVKQSSIQAAFVTKLVDDDSGLFSRHLQANELLVPWTLIADAIALRQPIGSIELPQGSHNHIFENEVDSVMILWNSSPVQEELFGCQDLTAYDVFGRPVAIQIEQLPSGSLVSRVPVAQWPVIVRGINANLIRWQQNFELLVDLIASESAAQGQLPVSIHNSLAQPASGFLTVHCETLFKGGSVSQELQLGPRSASRLEVPFQLRQDASAGIHQLEFAFFLDADRSYAFSLYRPLKLGHRDYEITWKARRINAEMVEMQAELVNHTDQPVSFDCKLFPQAVAYQRIQILDAPTGSSSHVRQLKIPASSRSKSVPMWIRCEKIGDKLILNYQASE